MTKADWRIGMAVTPKLQIHPWYRTIWVIRSVVSESANIKEMLVLQFYGQGRLGQVGCITITEPSDDWMSA